MSDVNFINVPSCFLGQERDGRGKVGTAVFQGALSDDQDSHLSKTLPFTNPFQVLILT